MTKTIPPAAFWVTLVALCAALAFALHVSMQSNDTDDVAMPANPPVHAAARPRAHPQRHARPNAAANRTERRSVAMHAAAKARTAVKRPAAKNHHAASQRIARRAAVVARATNVTVAFAPGNHGAGLFGDRHWSPNSAFAFSGPWEHVTGLYDGRSNGSSSRSYRVGANASLTFRGRYVLLYGILGPKGGRGRLKLDGKPAAELNFFAPKKSVHRLVYRSPPLQSGVHHLTIVVAPEPALADGRGRYINIDGAESGG